MSKKEGSARGGESLVACHAGLEGCRSPATDGNGCCREWRDLEGSFWARSSDVEMGGSSVLEAGVSWTGAWPRSLVQWQPKVSEQF